MKSNCLHNNFIFLYCCLSKFDYTIQRLKLACVNTYFSFIIKMNEPVKANRNKTRQAPREMPKQCHIPPCMIYTSGKIDINSASTIGCWYSAQLQNIEDMIWFGVKTFNQKPDTPHHCKLAKKNIWKNIWFWNTFQNTIWTTNLVLKRNNFTPWLVWGHNQNQYKIDSIRTNNNYRACSHKTNSSKIHSTERKAKKYPQCSIIK